MAALPVPVIPKPGQESVWDYPRPPRLEPTSKLIQVVLQDVCIAETRRAWRVLETSHPPVYYLPPAEIQMNYLVPVKGTSYCEWKGQAAYYDIVFGSVVAERAAWSYPDPSPSFAPIKDYLAFYPWAVDRCLVDGELARPQPGQFYGGWITSEIVGPFKGEPGSAGW